MSLTTLLHAATPLLPPPSPPWPTARPVLARAARCRPWTPPPSPRARPASRPWRTRVMSAMNYSPRPMQWVADLLGFFWCTDLGKSWKKCRNFQKKVWKYCTPQRWKKHAFQTPLLRVIKKCVTCMTPFCPHYLTPPLIFKLILLFPLILVLRTYQQHAPAMLLQPSWLRRQSCWSAAPRTPSTLSRPQRATALKSFQWVFRKNRINFDVPFLYIAWRPQVLSCEH